MASPSARPAQAGNTPSPKALSATPIVFESAHVAKPRAWRPSKPTAATVDQITVALGTVYARIAGSAVTFPMDVQLVFPDKTNDPSLTLRQPWLSAPGGRGGEPLFRTDDDASGKRFADSLSSIVDRFIGEYEKTPLENRVAVDGSLDHASAATLISVKTGGIRKTLTRKSA